MKNNQYQQLKEKTLSQFRSGKSLFGKEGAFTPLLKEFLESALQAEMEVHLSSEERTKGNKRNGKGRKILKSDAGTFKIETPQDRHSSFEPQIIRKRETILADTLEDKIIGLYGLGMSYKDISSHIYEMYDTQISAHVLQQVTDRITPQVKAWQNRAIDPIYAILQLDAMHFKVREDNQVKTKALYNIWGWHLIKFF